MDDSTVTNPVPNDALGHRCAKCKWLVKTDAESLAGADYCANPETQKVGLGILNALWKQIRELHEHNILTYTAYKGIVGHIKGDIDYVQDYGVPLNTPYGQQCFVAQETGNE